MRYVCTLLLVVFGNFVYLPVAKHRKGLVKLYVGLLSVSLFLLASGLFWNKLLDMAQFVSAASLMWLMFVLKGVIGNESQCHGARDVRCGNFGVSIILLLVVSLAIGKCLYSEKYSDFGVVGNQPRLEKFNRWIYGLWRGRVVGSTCLCVRGFKGDEHMYLACLVDKNAGGDKFVAQYQVFGEKDGDIPYFELTQSASVSIDFANNPCVTTEENMVVRYIVNVNARGLASRIVRFEYKNSFAELIID